MLEFCKAQKEEFLTIRDLYWRLIDATRGESSFPKWEKGIHPSDEFLQDSITKGELYVLKKEGRIAACVVVNQEDAGYEHAPWKITAARQEVLILHVLAVDPKERGAGLGGAMLDQIIGMARTQGIRAIRLDVIENNRSAEQFYKKKGFRYIETRDIYYDVTGRMTFLLYELVLV